MKTIQLTQGQVTKVDDDDFYKFGKFKWNAHYSPDGDCFYAVRGQGDKKIRFHREILAAPIGFPGDHINHDTLDNQKFNLRVCPEIKNHWNLKGPHRDSSSGIRGVLWDKSRKKWRAEICVNFKRIYLGRFDKKNDAMLAYASANKKYFGNFGGRLT